MANTKITCFIILRFFARGKGDYIGFEGLKKNFEMFLNTTRPGPFNGRSGSIKTKFELLKLSE